MHLTVQYYVISGLVVTKIIIICLVGYNIGFVSVGIFSRIPPIPPQIGYFHDLMGFVSVGRFNFFNRTYRLFSEYSALLQYFGGILLL